VTQIVHTPSGHPAVKPKKIGVLLVNLGSPDAPTPSAVRRYLKQFLSDRRVIELSPLLWQPILRGIILNTRPAKSAKKYASVWGKVGTLAPLVQITSQQATALQNEFGENAVVRFAMRYGNPAIPDQLNHLFYEQGCDRILIAPLYPQYCAATTASIVDEVSRWQAKQRWQPALRYLPPYYDSPVYISAITDSLREHIAALPWAPDRIMLSFHGMPRETLDKGDPYQCQSQKTARLVRESLGHDAPPLQITFQSRFGPKKWLEPYTDKTLEDLAASGTKNIVLQSPGFAADCLETLEEIAMEAKETFLHAGADNFSYVPCLNDSLRGIEMLQTLIRNELKGWL
jgi:protoporphyrin/coproporphyrin ferrochelatase